MGNELLTPDRFFTQHGQHRLRVLVVAAQPFAEARPLDLRREWADLERALRDGPVPVSLARLNPPTLAGLERALLRCRQAGVAPHVLHFAGHGEPDRLLFEDELGGDAWVDRDEFERVLSGAEVRVLVLNACHSASRDTIGFVRAVRETGAVAVGVGHQVPVPDAEALAFSAAFYRGLALGQTVDGAFRSGRNAMTSFDARLAVGQEGEGGFQVSKPGTSAEVRPADGRPERFVVAGAARFFGRAREALEIGGWLADGDVRAVAITGMGGIGKSSLARQVAERHAWRFPGGVVEATARLVFEAPTTAALLGQAAVGLRRPQTAGATALVQDLLAHAGEAPTLFLFDNLEDLAREELERLLRFAELVPPGSKVLLTLRPAPEALGGWAWLRALPLVRGLSAPAAVDRAAPGPGDGPGPRSAAPASPMGRPWPRGWPPRRRATPRCWSWRWACWPRGGWTRPGRRCPRRRREPRRWSWPRRRSRRRWRSSCSTATIASMGPARRCSGCSRWCRRAPWRTPRAWRCWRPWRARPKPQPPRGSRPAPRPASPRACWLGTGTCSASTRRSPTTPASTCCCRRKRSTEASPRSYRAPAPTPRHTTPTTRRCRGASTTCSACSSVPGGGDPPTRAVVAQAVGALGYYLQGTGRWAVYEAWRLRLATVKETPAALSSRLYRDALHASNRGQPAEARRLLGSRFASKQTSATTGGERRRCTLLASSRQRREPG
ncbi:MAG: CHAT domain-containing protein [bacterium]